MAQVTCLCNAYRFPHRLAGGLCNASEWCGSYRENGASLCASCNCLVDGRCDVEDGGEGIKHCEAYLEMLRYDDGTRYPLDIVKVYRDALYRAGDYYDR